MKTFPAFESTCLSKRNRDYVLTDPRGEVLHGTVMPSRIPPCLRLRGSESFLHAAVYAILLDRAFTAATF